MKKEQYEQTFKAIEGSIIKWKGIAETTEKDMGPHNCPLCGLFYWSNVDPHCKECPVMEVTGVNCCNETPYVLFTKHWDLTHTTYIMGPRHVVCPECERLAQEEIKFLNDVKDKFIRQI